MSAGLVSSEATPLGLQMAVFSLGLHRVFLLYVSGFQLPILIKTISKYSHIFRY